jgi:hypothetical protein
MAVAASSKGGLMLRCDPAATDALSERPGAGPFEMRGKELEGWLQVDSDAVTSEEGLQHWVEIGVNYAQTLPPK